MDMPCDKYNMVFQKIYMYIIIIESSITLKR